jgi:heme A synthase
MTVPVPAAQLAARLTMARVIAADYAQLPASDEAARHDWREWAARLHAALAGLLVAIDAVTSATGIAGTALLAPADVGTVLGALTDAADWRAARGDRDTLARYRGLSYRLGDDR